VEGKYKSWKEENVKKKPINGKCPPDEG